MRRRLCNLWPFLSEALLGAHRDTGVSFMYVRIMLSLFQPRLLVSAERRGHNKERGSEGRSTAAKKNESDKKSRATGIFFSLCLIINVLGLMIELLQPL